MNAPAQTETCATGSARAESAASSTDAADAKPVTAGKSPLLNRQIKDTVFSDLFSSKKNLLALYRALHPEDTAATESDIANVTMKNIFLRDLYNDLGFTVRDKLLLLVEAQSTWTVNVIFRLFMYLAETWGEYIKVTGQNIYGTKKITLPQAESYVVFTGERKGKPDTISLFEEFGVSFKRNSVSLERNSVSLTRNSAPTEQSSADERSSAPSERRGSALLERISAARRNVPADERMIELKARVIFADEDAGAIGKRLEGLGFRFQGLGGRADYRGTRSHRRQTNP